MFIIEVPYFDLDQIYNSGQVFSWIKLRDSKYIIPFRNQAVKIEQKKEKLFMNCTEEQFYNIWYHYFDMKTDYCSINFKIKQIDEHMKICTNRGKGIHILNQDIFEMIITFILATATNIPRIKSMVNSIKTLCGKKHVQSMGEVGKVFWYEFPTPQDILRKQNNLDLCKLGYRKDYIVSVCQDIIDGWLSLIDLEKMEYKSAKEYLMQFDGIGEKVADCICLYGLHHLQAFPIDTHIEQILKREYDCDYEIFSEWYLDGLNEYAGIAQQYLFYNEINPPKEVV